MKRLTAFIALCLGLLLCLSACGSEAQTELVGKTYVYENEGFFGDFTITLNDDGSFSYYEGFASSYIGMGQWTLDGNRLRLDDENRTNVFALRDGRLIWQEDGSDNFLYVKLSDGDAFLADK